MTCKDLVDEYPLNETRKSYSTIWYLDENSLGNVTDIINNGKESNVTDVLKIKEYFKSLPQEDG